MRSIQEVGTEILTQHPKNFYIFTGEEFGVKEKYIRQMESLYGSKVEAPRVMDLLDSMSKKQLIPLPPAVYVVRYDEDFLSKVDANTVSRIQKAKISGTIVCIYESEKGVSKLEKHLGDYTVEITKFGRQFVVKYLHQDFPKLPDRLIEIAATVGENYNHSINICRMMSFADVESLFKFSDQELMDMFGRKAASTDNDVRKGVAARSFTYLNQVLEKYEDEPDKFLYSMLSALLELDKVTDSKYSQSDLRDYGKYWDKQDIYNMFMHTYEEIKKLRTYATDGHSSVLYLAGLLQFRPIPPCQEV